MKKTAPSLNLVDDGVLVKRQELGEKDCVIGRGPDCDWVVNGKQVSRSHARLVREGGGYAIEDLGSTNGVYVNGARTRRQLLAHGDQIGLGGLAIVFDDGRGIAGVGDTTLAERPGDETLSIRTQYESLSRKLADRGAARDLERLHRTAERSRQRFKDQAHRDRLTGLYNRRYFDQQLERLWQESAGARQPLSLVFIDLDHFKAVNDTHGHDKGDEVLKVAARLIQAACRRDDVVARYGGEEFVAAFPGMAAGDAAAAAEAIRKLIAEQSAGLTGLRLTASIGVATRGGRDRECGTLVRRADRAVYRAKAAGRDRVEIADA
ncbi:MAG: GGDEF domain-containing protein [Candidatus Edwardsbacteria bacterium]|nr:GGDEF domain-containing protein [Candidatus Edwardsbacteria bacterium]